jgi:ERCC4-type nuclease
MIKIEIDYREKYILKDFLSRDLDIYKDKIEINSKNLELADIIIIIESINKTFYFERKTLADLTSSITDGRYKEQKKRLLSNIDPNNITYIIEGDTINKSLLRNNTSIQSVYFRTLYRDNIKIIFTNNIQETVTFILSFVCNIIKCPDKYINNIDNNIDNYLSNVKIKSKKIENITPDNCYLLQLSQIPTISFIISKYISEKYSSMPILINELQKIEDYNNKIKELCKIQKIGKEKAIKILKFLNLNH